MKHLRAFLNLTKKQKWLLFWGTLVCLITAPYLIIGISQRNGEIVSIGACILAGGCGLGLLMDVASDKKMTVRGILKLIVGSTLTIGALVLLLGII